MKKGEEIICTMPEHSFSGVLKNQNVHKKIQSYHSLHHHMASLFLQHLHTSPNEPKSPLIYTTLGHIQNIKTNDRKLRRGPTEVEQQDNPKMKHKPAVTPYF
jgi:hypothetical protein